MKDELERWTGKMNWLKPFFLFAKDISINTEWRVNKVPV